MTTPFWVARGSDDRHANGCSPDVGSEHPELWFFDCEPRYRVYDLNGSCEWVDDDGHSGWCHVEMWRALGLSEEPANGTCWRVDWQDHVVRIDQGSTFIRSIPVAVDVTAELKAKAAIHGSHRQTVHGT